MTTLIDHVPINQPTGTHTYGAYNVPDGVSSATLRIARCTTATPTFWPNASTTVDAKAMMSFDNGATFPYQVATISSKGGIVTHPDTGEQVTETGVSVTGVRLGANRKIQATITVTNGPLVTQVTLEVS